MQGDPLKTLMIRHLSRSTKKNSLSLIFSRYGHLENCRVVRDVISGKSRGYAFVEFKHERDARAALRECRDLVIDDQKVVVDSECERTLDGWIPRRFGGGFGGRKESGQLRFGGVERPFRRPIPVNSKPLGTKKNRNEDRQQHYENTKRMHHDHNRKHTSHAANKRFKR